MCSVRPDSAARGLFANASPKRVFVLLKSRGSGKCGEAKRALIFGKLGLKLLFCALLSKCSFRSVWKVADFRTDAVSFSLKALIRFWSSDLKL